MHADPESALLAHEATSLSQGLHWMMDFADCLCESELLGDAERLATACETACGTLCCADDAPAEQQEGAEADEASDPAVSTASAAASAGSTRTLFRSRGADGRHSGISGLLLLACGHLAIHTRPATRRVTLDLYLDDTDGPPAARAQSVVEAMTRLLMPTHAQQQRVSRMSAHAPGLPPGLRGIFA